MRISGADEGKDVCLTVAVTHRSSVWAALGVGVGVAGEGKVLTAGDLYTLQWVHHPEAAEGKGITEGENLKSDVTQQQWEFLAQRALETSSGLGPLLAPGFILFMASRYWRQFQGVCKASRLPKGKQYAYMDYI